MDLALYQPEIPQNAGTLIRLSACLDFALHVIHPLGFSLTDKHFKRAALDYRPESKLIEHAGYAQFDEWRRRNGRQLVLLTTKAASSAYDYSFGPGDILLLGRETAGVPPDVAASADVCIRIPMRPTARSINVALAAAMMMGEAYRQTAGFAELS